MTISVLPTRRRLRFRPRTSLGRLRFRAAMAREKLRFVPGVVKPRPVEPSEPTSRLKALGSSLLAAAALASAPLLLVEQPAPHVLRPAQTRSASADEAEPSPTAPPSETAGAAVATEPVRRAGRRGPRPESPESLSLAQQFAAAVTGIDGPPPNPYRLRR